MHDGEKVAFRDLMVGVAAYYDRKLDRTTVGIYWNGLADLPLEAVRQALNAHVQDPKAGQFMPKIADIRRAIESSREDGHPGADEAWSIALQARHESATVVWTEQISDAFFTAAMPLLDEGDKIAARRAFIERYEHVIAEARKQGIDAKWIVSLGANADQRAQAIESAVRQGRLTTDYAHKLLPPPEAAAPGAMLALENGIKDAAGSPEQAQANIARLRAILGIERAA